MIESTKQLIKEIGMVVVGLGIMSFVVFILAHSLIKLIQEGASKYIIVAIAVILFAIILLGIFLLINILTLKERD